MFKVFPALFSGSIADAGKVIWLAALQISQHHRGIAPDPIHRTAIGLFNRDLGTPTQLLA